MGKIKILFATGMLALSLVACSEENNEKGDLQNGNPAIGGEDENESPQGEKDTREEFEDDVMEQKKEEDK